MRVRAVPLATPAMRKYINEPKKSSETKEFAFWNLNPGRPDTRADSLKLQKQTHATVRPL
jgi:hypothetical protein